MCNYGNSQTNSILERIHQVISNLVHTFDFKNNYLSWDDYDPWSGSLSAMNFAVRGTYHTTLHSTPGQLVFGCDMILNAPFIVDWEYIRKHKPQLIHKNNKNEINSQTTPLWITWKSTSAPKQIKQIWGTV